MEGVDHPEVVSTALAVYPVQWISRKGLLSPRLSGLSRRILQHPVLTFARGTQPQRALEEILANMADQEGIPIEQTRLTCSPSVAAIPGLFVKDDLDTGEFLELPLQPALPPVPSTWPA